MKKPKQAIIWDLDGTLWDACDTVAVAWNSWCRENGVDLSFSPDDCRACCGKTLPQIARMIFPDRDQDWAEWAVSGCCDAECVPLAENGGILYPDEPAVLELLHQQYFMAVVSNCGLGYIEAFFSGNQTGKYFDDYENAVRTGKTKGENIRLVMERNGIERAVYIGDTMGDCEAAAEAGIPFLHAAYGFGRVSDAPQVRSISEIPDAIRLMLS